MVIWMLAAIAVYYAGVFLPPMFLLPKIGVAAYAGHRDQDPAPGLIHGRALRAQRNMAENLPVFLGLALLSIVLPEADISLAISGAAVFVLARLVYLPLYLMAVPYLRSLVYGVGLTGQIVMALALL
ncbi:MAPEG family protein [Candidatus Halocynthiibacter alkanivorans]|uniref:MAPEG family protein n=1 Tax=Candidatus Halocynthiibacter alkanivorans TaxID=2267619 RepID=UPI0013598242|nr:MAPEG family protein [Candidatus Halocynthiibacter alkanivorans]